MEYTVLSTSKEMTLALAKSLSSCLDRGDVVLLDGDLGAGKTTFVGGVAKGLGIEEEVISPTFNIMKCYFQGRIPLYHIDAYRLEGQNIEIGLDEYIEGDGACFIEWPAFISPLLPDEALRIEIRHKGEGTREIKFVSSCPRFDGIIQKLKEGK